MSTDKGLNVVSQQVKILSTINFDDTITKLCTVSSKFIAASNNNLYLMQVLNRRELTCLTAVSLSVFINTRVLRSIHFISSFESTVRIITTDAQSIELELVEPALKEILNMSNCIR